MADIRISLISLVFFPAKFSLLSMSPLFIFVRWRSETILLGAVKPHQVMPIGEPVPGVWPRQADVLINCLLLGQGQQSQWKSQQLAGREMLTLTLASLGLTRVLTWGQGPAERCWAQQVLSRAEPRPPLPHPHRVRGPRPEFQRSHFGFTLGHRSGDGSLTHLDPALQGS